MRIQGHPIVAYDPSGLVFAIALNERSSILLYDIRKFDQNPFATITIDDTAALSQVTMPPRIPVITHLSFNHTGQYILAGTSGDVHYVIDSYTGQLMYRLTGHVGLERANGASVGLVPKAGISGQEMCWTPDGRMVLAGSATGQVYVWALPERPPSALPSTLHSHTTLQGQEGTPRVVAFNPRCAHLCTAGTQVAFWLPDLP